MELYTFNSDALRTLCQSRNKWGMLISFTPSEKDIEAGVIKDAPYLNVRNPLLGQLAITVDMMCGGGGILLFDTEEEMRKYYGMTYGDDDGGNVYALTCGPDGNLLTENT